jgi:hypothetical protein
MGYDLHITRAEHWAENEGCPITYAEWLAIVEADPELRSCPENGPDFAIWIDPQTGADKGWLGWFDGDIYSKYPDPALLGKMLELAAKLRAKVQGDDGEPYRSSEDHPNLS